MARFWEGSPPIDCDACGDPLVDEFSDMATKLGPWGKLCHSCATCGVGIGIYGPGKGQEYTKQPDGSWLKTKG